MFLIPRCSRLKKDTDSFLFVPGQNQGKGKVIDLAAECFCQGCGHLDGAECIVALSHVQKAGNAGQGSKLQVIKAVFAAGQGQNKGVLRRLLYKVRVVIPAGTAPSQPPTRKMWRSLFCLTACATVPAAARTASRPNPVVTLVPPLIPGIVTSSLKPPSSRAFWMTGEKSLRPSIWTMPG